MIALEGNTAAMQGRLPTGWKLAPYAGDDLRRTLPRAPTCTSSFHEDYAVRAHDGQQPAGLAQLGYITFVSRAGNPGDG